MPLVWRDGVVVRRFPDGVSVSECGAFVFCFRVCSVCFFIRADLIRAGRTIWSGGVLLEPFITRDSLLRHRCSPASKLFWTMSDRTGEYELGNEP